MTERKWTLSNDSNVRLRGFYEEGEAESPAQKPTIIVLPGGGYLSIARNEGSPVAAWFCRNGYRAFVLEYSTAWESFEARDEMNENVRFPGPAWDLASALIAIRTNAQSWGVDPERVSLCGFSAGGHLAAWFCNKWADLAKELNVEPRYLRPNADILCYAASDMMADAEDELEKFMYQAIFGTQTPSMEERASLTAKFSVNSNTPPTLLWHSASDRMVPARHSMELALALAEAGIQYELHVFDKGVHADGLSEGMPAQIWPQLADHFLKRHM